MKAFFGKIWAWVIAHKLIAGIAAGAAALVIATSVIVPVSVSSAKKKKASEQQTQQSEGESQGGQQSGGQQSGGQQGGEGQGGQQGGGSGGTAATYTIVWKNDDGTVLETDSNVAEGVTPSYDSAEPTKASTAQYDYSFAGWSPVVTNVSANAEYVATYSSTVRKYTVQFLDEDESLIDSKQVDYGTMPVAPTDPTKDETAEYTYAFGGWDHAIEEVHGNQTYIATYNSTKRSYLVHFKNYDGSELVEPFMVEYGQTPTYTGATPVKSKTETETFTWLGWDVVPGPVTGEVSYTATFTSSKTKYRYDFINDDDSELTSVQNVDYDVEPATAYNDEDPVSSQDYFNMTFTGWSMVGGRDTTNYVVTYKANYSSTGISQDKWFTFVDNGDETYSISAISDQYDADNLVIPSTYSGKPVVQISSNAGYSKHNLKNVVIPSSVTTIGESAFNSCSNLESVLIQGHPDINHNAFRMCPKLENFEIVGGGEYNFGSDVFKYSKVTNLVLGEGLTSIPFRFFEYNSTIKSVSLPASVEGIQGQAFYQCTSLETVTFAAGSECDGIGNSAFFGCSSLTSITLPDALINIGPAAFGSTGLTSISIPDNVTTLQYDAFCECPNLANVHIGKSVLKDYLDASDDPFRDSPVQAFTVSGEHGTLTATDGVLYAGTQLYRYPAGKQGAFTVQDTVTSFEIGAFENCTGITSVDLSATEISSIPAECFKNSSLSSINLPATIQSFFGEAFYGTNLESLTIPSSVDIINISAFGECEDLTSLTIEGTKFVFENGAIYNTGKVKMIGVLASTSGEFNTVPASCTQIGDEAFMYAKNVTSVVLPDTVDTLGQKSFKGFEGSVILGNGIHSIPNYAFQNAVIGSITLPTALTSIGAGSFQNCDIATVILPNTCTSLGDSTFAGCTNLTTISLSSVTSIPSRCFDGCTALASITWSSAITYVGNNAFNRCTSLENDDITLPAALEELWSSAFTNLSLTEITYLGTKAQWADVDISDGWTNCITTVNCSDGPIAL